MAVLVTGATGFLGRHVLQALACDPDFSDTGIVVLVRDQREWASYEWARDIPAVKLLEGSITDSSAWRDDTLLNNLTGIFHLAALVRHSRRDADEVYRVNIEGTLELVKVASHHRCRMVYVSTSGTVGCSRRAADQADEEAPYCQAEVSAWPYYDSKIRAEQSAMQLARELGTELVIVRPPVLLGPGDHRFRSTGQVIRFLRGRLPFLIRGGIHYVDIRDASAALVAAMKHPRPRAVYHLQGTACSIDRFFSDLGAIADVPLPRFHLPYRLALGLARVNEWVGMRIKGQPLALLPDPVVIEMAARYWDIRSRYAEQDLGFMSRDGQETLRDTVQWLRTHRSDC